ncbi:hypothetical protein DVH05_007527 [Phytophthora capsici]|nr:hypothetical protein DVH05_007527 [Phytophthora capsici]
MTSMADHLRSQEYERVRRSKSMLTEPHLSDEDAARLVDAYERNDTSDAEYLALMTEQQPFTPLPTTHAVIIDSGTYCSTVAMRVVINSFLQDHGNAVVKELLSNYEVAMIEKAPSGGVLIHVHSSDAERMLIGQEVNLLGRRFKVKHQSPLANKFFLDVFGVRSTTIANNLFMGLAALGARPLFMTPRDVNMETHVTTPTWRFYFGQEEPPACLKVHGFVTNQLVYGRKFFIVRGKRTDDPPERAVGFKKSSCAVTLQVGIEPQEEGVQGEDHDAATQDGTPRRDERRVQKSKPMHRTVSEVAESGYPSPNSNGRPSPETEEEDTEMQSAPSDEDVDMGRQMETGFKRIERSEPSFADPNPFEALDELDCEFETFEPNVTTEPVSGMILIPHLTSSSTEDADKEPLPTKRRYKRREATVRVQVVADEEVVASAKATELEAQDDRISFNMEHLKPVTELMNGSKNMDKIMDSMAAMPTAWSTAICSDLAKGGKCTDELATLHLFNRILVTEGATSLSFNQRVLTSKLPMGKSRETFLEFLKANIEQQSPEIKNQWNTLRLLSAFELLMRTICPFLSESNVWTPYLVGESDAGIVRGKCSLLSDETLLGLLRSRLGHQVLAHLSAKLTDSPLIADIISLESSAICQRELPIITLKDLSPIVEAIQRN